MKKQIEWRKVVESYVADLGNSSISQGQFHVIVSNMFDYMTETTIMIHDTLHQRKHSSSQQMNFTKLLPKTLNFHGSTLFHMRHEFQSTKTGATFRFSSATISGTKARRREAHTLRLPPMSQYVYLYEMLS